MDKYGTKQIRNVVLLGHSGCGKTSLAESMLYITKATDRLGNIADGNTVCDYDPEEIKRGYSISSTFASTEWNETKINILDTPGFFDFEGEARQCVRVADAAIIVVDGKSGIQVGTELAWKMTEAAKMPKAFFINRFDDGEARFRKVFDALREKYGVTVCPVQIPVIDGPEVVGFANLVEMCMFTYTSGGYVKNPIPEKFKDVFDEFHAMFMEAIAQTSDELLEKFFNEEEITREESIEALHEGIIHGDIVPVFCGSAVKNWGIKTLLDTIANSFPRTTAKKNEITILENGEKGELPIDPASEKTSLFVFKTVADPFVGKLSYFKVMNGSLKKDMALKNMRSEAVEKFSKILYMQGKKQFEIDELACGDIGVIPKLATTNTNDTLTNEANAFSFLPIAFPKPNLTMAIELEGKGDEDKISGGIARLLEEDCTLSYENNSETKQMTVSGLGDIHLDILCAKLKSRFGASVKLSKPKIAYRETIKGKVDAEGKHKKQSGGSGQYGHVKIHFGPGPEEGLTFTESVFGGAVPKNYFPAVEQGLKDCMEKGILAGYPVVRLAADLYDGSYHEVDSNEISFKLAAALAFKDGLPRANPILLEPVCEYKIKVPENYVGDVMGDLNKRRGKVLGIEADEDSDGQVIVSEAPLAEMLDYVIALRAMTQGRGRFTYEIIRYDEVPANVADKIIKEANA